MSAKIGNYLRLEKKIEQISHLGSISALLHWDSAVLLPSGAAVVRHQETAALSSLIHEMSVDKEMGELIEAAEAEADFLDEWQRANLKLVKKSHTRETTITPEMKYEFSLACGESEFIWRKCRAESDFKTLVPYLNRVFKAAREIADARSLGLGVPAYDALVDSYDPDRQLSEIDEVFSFLKGSLPSLVTRIMEKQSVEKPIKLTKKIDEATQKEIGTKVLKKMGFDLDRGRLDKSTHPFCSGNRSNVRLTARYDENNFLSGLLAVIHETGHGLYQQNLPAKYANQPVGGAMGMAFHESQSLLMEMQACATTQFTEFLAKLLKDDFNITGVEYSAENLYKLMTRVTPSFIRVDADEVTYPLHVILRFEIEREIINGNVTAEELPEIWNSKMKEYLGITPETPALGCLQDIHWPSGLLGYFPAYTNGAIIASMVMKKALEQNKGISAELAQGEFKSLNDYLNKNLREHGSLKSSPELLMESTGYFQIQPQIFMEYLENKYLK